MEGLNTSRLSIISLLPSHSLYPFIFSYHIQFQSTLIKNTTMPKAKKKTTGTKSKSGGSKKQKLDVPVLTEDEKRVVLIQYEKENDSEGAESLLTEYLKFMQLKIGEQGTNDKCAPSDRIDEMWHGKVFHDDG